MKDDAAWRNYKSKLVEDRELDQFIGLAQGVLADGIVNQSEAEMIQSWLQQSECSKNPYIMRLLQQLQQVLSDGVLDEEEALELRDALREWVGGGVLHGEEPTSASLPLDPGERTISIPDSIFVFTGKGIYGSREEMQRTTVAVGGVVEKSVTKRTNYVVLGTYVTAAWRHQTFGRKIEKAMHYRDDTKTGLQIVHEDDWVNAVERIAEEPELLTN